jgi:hypothetical protein
MNVQTDQHDIPHTPSIVIKQGDRKVMIWKYGMFIFKFEFQSCAPYLIEKCKFVVFSYPWPKVLQFLHNVFDHNTEVKLIFCYYYVFYGSKIMPTLNYNNCIFQIIMSGMIFFSYLTDFNYFFLWKKIWKL